MFRSHLLRLAAAACCLTLLSACEDHANNSLSAAMPRLGIEEPGGVLTVHLGGFLGQVKQQRQTLGLSEEVQQVIVTVSSSEGTESQILDAEDLEATPAATFADLPPGPVIVTSEAFTGEDRPSTSAVGSATVVAGGNAEIALPQSAKTGTLVIRAKIVDGPVVEAAAPKQR